MRALATTLILVAALVNLAPVVGVLSVDRLGALYGVALEDTNLIILLRHRAVLFGIVGGILLAAAFHPPLRPAGFAIGLISMLSFVLIAWIEGGANAQLWRVVVIDLVASSILVGAALLDYFSRA